MCTFQPFTIELHSCSYVRQSTVIGVRNLALAGRNRWHYFYWINLRFIQNVASCYELCLTKESVITATLVHAPMCVCAPRAPHGGLSDTSALEISSGGGSGLNSLTVRTLRSPDIFSLYQFPGLFHNNVVFQNIPIFTAVWIHLNVCKTWSKKNKHSLSLSKVWEVRVTAQIPVRCSQVLYTRLQAGIVLCDLLDAPTVVFTIKPTQSYFSPISIGPIRAPRSGHRGQVSRHPWTPGQASRHLDSAARLFVVSVAKSGWRFPAQKLTKTRPLQQKPAQNFNCQNNVIWFYYHVNQD